MNRSCTDCGKAFPNLSQLKRHKTRKTPCSPIVRECDLTEAERANKHPCKYCGRRLATPQSLSRHIRQFCKIAGSREGMELLYEHTLREQEAEMKKVKEENALMKFQLRRLECKMQQLEVYSQQGCQGYSSDKPAMVNTAFLGPVVNNTTIVINNFGQENSDHIGPTEVKQLLDRTLECVKNPTQAALTAMLAAATLIYSDPEHPENLTCYLPNKKTDDVMVHGKRGWEIKPYTMVLPPMVAKSLDTVFAHQPFEDASKYGELMKALKENEEAYQQGKEMKTILVRNKALLDEALSKVARAKIF